MIIINDPITWSLKQIKIIEKKYQGRYVLESCLKGKDGEWLNFPAAIFYTEKAHPEGSNYFALFNMPFPDERLMISNGLSAIEQPIKGLLIDGVILYSRYRHDFREFHGINIDGGRDYFKYGGERMNEAKKVCITVVRDKVYFEYMHFSTLHELTPSFSRTETQAKEK